MMEMVEMKSDELNGPALDWAVATAEGWSHPNLAKPSIEWTFGGPLLDKYKVGFGLYHAPGRQYIAVTGLNDVDYGFAYGPTHLIAACRAIVVAVMGDSVQVPAMLIKADHDE